MSAWAIGVVGVVYLGVAVDQFLKGQQAMALVWFGYALANAGFVITTK